MPSPLSPRPDPMSIRTDLVQETDAESDSDLLLEKFLNVFTRTQYTVGVLLGDIFQILTDGTVRYKRTYKRTVEILLFTWIYCVNNKPTCNQL